MGQSTPSHYNSIDLDRFKCTSPKYDWKISKTVRISPIKKTPKEVGEISPSTYKPDESLKKRIFNNPPNYSYPREKGKSFIERYQKSKAFLPAPSHYNTDKAYSVITIGARRGYK